MRNNAKKLYGHWICKKCYYAFANRRQLAFVIDRVAWQLPVLAVSLAIGFAIGLSGGKITPDVENVISFLAWPLFLVFLFKDGFSGYSIGKLICDVRAVDSLTHEPIGFVASFKRNLPIYIPFVPLYIAYQLQKGNRLGDGWSKSMVIWNKYAKSHVFGGTGSCEVCQYDLTANVSGVCPECGTPVSARNRAASGVATPV
jgi:uncharacterized RDD family membrane protein YckC